MDFINYLTSNIFKQPPIFLGLVALIGLLVQRKSFSDIINGTFKTIIGVIVLFKGVNIIAASISPLAGAFSGLYNIPEANQFDPAAWLNILGDYGSTIGLVIVLAFAINLLVARISPIKNIFLTGHIFFWMSYIFVCVGVEVGLTGAKLVAFATAFLSIYIIFVPAMLRPFVKQVTGSDDFTIGHSCSLFCVIGAYIGKIFGNKEKSAEDLKIPTQLEFFRNTTIATSLFMFATYIVVGLVIGSEARVAAFGGSIGSIATIGGMQYDLFSFSLMAGLTFGAGMTVLLAGVRLMLGEIVPAFKGISDKIIPNAIPALDCPMVFPFAPNSLLLGFLISMVTSTLAIIILASTGMLTYAVIPLTVACFFDIAPGAIFANATGGRRGVIISSIVGGVLIVVLAAGSMAVLKGTGAGFVQAFGGNDFSLWAMIGSVFGKIF
ncbi:PTS ascorbate transporter subunit IIC [Abyssisolibacter fermentans]|uniref:PTS ascorbate transporter subunit IIC n=1 Tax=Abyssisolibacter fermentans TaxID=1766203 RepID=UPI0008333C6C|nr:PTS ascorbate transporter subunit IIC [Abyssisolibacter fermentans]